jgi:hypothetical protein
MQLLPTVTVNELTPTVSKLASRYTSLISNPQQQGIALLLTYVLCMIVKVLLPQAQQILQGFMLWLWLLQRDGDALQLEAPAPCPS